MPIAIAMEEPLPQPPSFDVEFGNQSEKIEQRRRLRDIFGFSKWRNREDQIQSTDRQSPPQTPIKPDRPALGRRFSRRGLVGIPRSQTFKRQEDEQRKNLEPVSTSTQERRKLSKVRQRALSAAPESPRPKYRDSSVPPDFPHAYQSIGETIGQRAFIQAVPAQLGHQEQEQEQEQEQQIPPPPPPHPPPEDRNLISDIDSPTSEVSYDDDALDEELMEELKKKWILNLSMHFRDKSPREKFFLMYAETPDRWRRVTVSCDYRNAPLDSLESDLQNLHYQKDKSARIYESIRMSLPDIKFYDTVTNLKLETKDDRLHVHVTEDVNEIIPYPPIHLVNHLRHVHRYKEKELHFDEHMSGFVYKVNVGGHTWIKKEIPGPDSVDEFLYEVNGLSELIGSKNVIQLKGLVIDNDEKLIKGLLLCYAEQGAIVDIIYDSREGHIPRVPWPRRERWAKQIIQGLSNLHEAGFVQGDFTLSNIVIDDNDEAQIIDINRRGCPVGWESPEMVPLVESGQRLSMYIGVKSDLYQLGMVLWALAMEKDEPERASRPLSLEEAGNDIPQYYKHLTRICLSEKPTQRFAAKDLLAMFSAPALFSDLRRQDMSPLSASEQPGSPNPDQGHNVQVDNADIMGMTFSDRQKRYQRTNGTLLPSLAGHEPHNKHPARSRGTDEEGFRGRRYSPIRSGTLGVPPDESPALSISRRGTYLPMKQLSFTDRTAEFLPGRNDENDTQIVPISPTGNGAWQEILMDGNPYLVHRDTLESFDEFPHAEKSVKKNDVDQWRHEVQHVDSGLADINPESVTSTLNPLLAGIGGHDTLDYGQQFGSISTPPQRITDDLDVERQEDKEPPRDITADFEAEQKFHKENLRGTTEDHAREPASKGVYSQSKTEDLGLDQHGEEKDKQQGLQHLGLEHSDEHV